MTDKQHAHDLLDRVPPDQLAAVVHLLESIVESDELSDTDRQAIAEADEWLKTHKPIPNEEILAEFGLTSADWEKMADEPEELPSRNGSVSSGRSRPKLISAQSSK